MKKAVKVILPILLTLAILFSIGWYLFVYDTEFTRDMLLTCARHFEAQGDHSTAAWFYDLAYDQAGDNDAVAIELARQHTASGNYTQAELTLSNAISDGGGVDLYIALCNLYVEQDKLLDVVKLLDAICSENSTVDPAVRQALIEKRPAAPTATPDPGFYSQYITVTVTGAGGTLRVNNEYPSILDRVDTYNDEGISSCSVTLSEGENSIYALTVSEEGLVSPLSIFGYTVGGVIEKVDFSDPAIEAQVRSTLNVAENTVLYSNDLWNIKEFTIPEGATNLDDLKHMIRLNKLTITAGPAGQLSFLSAMSDLTSLTIMDTQVAAEELPLIAALPRLTDLTLRNCGLSTTAGLEKAVNLISLDLSENTIRNISALSACTGLQILDLHSNALIELDALSGLTRLSQLDISYNTIASTAKLSSLTELKQLNLSHNAITDISPIGNLTALQSLSLGYNQLSDISPLAACTGLTQLDISNNTIADLSALTALTDLSVLDFNHNQVAVLPAWDSSYKLVSIDGSHNLLTSLEPLRGMGQLNKVFVDYNPELESIECLTDCHLLIQVNAYGTKVTEVKALLDMSVIVNYDPTADTN